MFNSLETSFFPVENLLYNKLSKENRWQGDTLKVTIFLQDISAPCITAQAALSALYKNIQSFSIQNDKSFYQRFFNALVGCKSSSTSERSKHYIMNDICASLCLRENWELCSSRSFPMLNYVTISVPDIFFYSFQK